MLGVGRDYRDIGLYAKLVEVGRSKRDIGLFASAKLLERVGRIYRDIGLYAKLLEVGRSKRDIGLFASAKLLGVGRIYRDIGLYAKLLGVGAKFLEGGRGLQIGIQLVDFPAAGSMPASKLSKGYRIVRGQESLEIIVSCEIRIRETLNLYGGCILYKQKKTIN